MNMHGTICFAHQLFIRPSEEEFSEHEAGFTVICAPNFKADPSVDGTNSETFIIISFENRTVLIGGTEYAGEIEEINFQHNELSITGERHSTDALFVQCWA